MGLINFRKYYDSDGATQLLLRANHFVIPTVWFLLLGLNLITTIAGLICHHKVIWRLEEVHEYLAISVRAS